jgi:hypothetical protein
MNISDFILGVVVTNSAYTRLLCNGTCLKNIPECGAAKNCTSTFHCVGKSDVCSYERAKLGFRNFDGGLR